MFLKEASSDKEKGEHFHSIERRTVFINGKIHFHDGAYVSNMLHEISAEDSKKDIFVFINSGGGSVDAGFQIADTMAHLPNKVVTIGQGYVGSAATLIYAAGSRRTCTPLSVFMLHEFSNTIHNRFTSDLFARVAEMKLGQKMYAGFLAKQTGLSQNKWEKIMTPECNFFTAEESIKLNLVHEVVTDLSFAVKKYKTSEDKKKASKTKKSTSKKI